MTPILLTPVDLAIASVLIVLDAVLSLVLRLRLHRQLVWATLRMVVQLVLIGFILRWVFAIASPLITLAVVLAHPARHAHAAARPRRRLQEIGQGGRRCDG